MFNLACDIYLLDKCAIEKCSICSPLWFHPVFVAFEYDFICIWIVRRQFNLKSLSPFRFRISLSLCHNEPIFVYGFAALVNDNKKANGECAVSMFRMNFSDCHDENNMNVLCSCEFSWNFSGECTVRFRKIGRFFLVLFILLPFNVSSFDRFDVRSFAFFLMNIWFFQCLFFQSSLSARILFPQKMPVKILPPFRFKLNRVFLLSADSVSPKSLFSFFQYFCAAAASAARTVVSMCVFIICLCCCCCCPKSKISGKWCKIPMRGDAQRVSARMNNFST